MTSEEFNRIPFTHKKDLSLFNEEFLAVSNSDIFDITTTSGTTGEPVSFYLTRQDVDRLATNEAGSLKLAGATSNDRFQLMTTMNRQFMAGLAYYEGIKKLGAGKITVSGSGIGKIASQVVDFEVRTPNPELVKVYDRVLQPGESWSQAVNNVGIKGTNDLLVEVSSIPSINLEERLSYLIQYPHGCVEQTTSSVFPQLYLSEVMEVSSKLQNRIKGNVQKGINRLRSFKTSSGGLSYWPGGYESNDWGTIYATHFFKYFI